MISPNCPEHDRLVLDLALGRLDDGAAAEAEVVSETCPVCRAWWQEQFEGEVAAAVDGAVASVFENLDLPERRRSHGWLALAAAMIMALGAATLWLVQNPGTAGPGLPNSVGVERVAVIQSMDFESMHAVVPQPEASSVAAADFEEVDLDSVEGGSIAISVLEDGPMVVNSGTLFDGRFESGSLDDWVPST